MRGLIRDRPTKEPSSVRRGSYIKRRTRLRPRRKTQRRSERKRDAPYMLWVKGQPCCAYAGVVWQFAPEVFLRPCRNGDIEAHHAGRRPAGRKADDDTCIPLCSEHHRLWHSGGPPWEHWSQDRRRAWADARIAETREAYVRHVYAKAQMAVPF